jgi:hypothetical protein
MNINTLLNDFAEAVAQSSTIKTWTQANYSADHKVYAGMDTRDPPDENDCPYMALYPIRKLLGQHQREKHHEIEVVCCIHDTTTRAHDGITNLIEYKGVQNIESFRKLVETCIASVDIGNANLSLVTVDYEMIETFPFFMCGMVFNVWEGVTMGSDILL